jgi:hypothetical protein
MYVPPVLPPEWSVELLEEYGAEGQSGYEDVTASAPEAVETAFHSADAPARPQAAPATPVAAPVVLFAPAPSEDTAPASPEPHPADSDEAGEHEA